MNISPRFKAAILPFLVVAGTGTIFGALSGWLALFFAGGSVNSIVDFSSSAYLALAILLPLALLGTLLVFWDDDLVSDERLYNQPLRITGVLVLGGLLGAALATGLYILLVTLITSSIGSHDAVAVNSALSGRIGWQNVVIVIAVTAILALPISLWVYRKAQS